MNPPKETLGIDAGAGRALLRDWDDHWDFSRQEWDQLTPVLDLKSQCSGPFKSIVVIDSITAGKQLATNATIFKSLLEPLFTFLGIEHQYWKTNSESCIKSFADRITNDCLTIFLSGDTSISEFINQLYVNGNGQLEHQITILPFPQGSGNAIANSIGLSTPFKSLRALFKGNAHHLPLYQAQLTGATTLSSTPIHLAYFLIVFSWCLHSTLIHESDKPEMRSQYGTERFAIAAQNILKSDPIFITKDGEHLSYLLLTSLPKLEATFTISPKSKPDLDQLHSIIIPHIDPHEVMNIIMKGYDGGDHVLDSRVQYKPIHKWPWTFQISSQMDPNLSYICIDGTILQLNPQNNKVLINIVNQSQLCYLSL